MWCSYDTVNILKQIYNRILIAHLVGQDMGCLLWMWNLVYILSSLLCIFIHYTWAYQLLPIQPIWCCPFARMWISGTVGWVSSFKVLLKCLEILHIGPFYTYGLAQGPAHLSLTQLDGYSGFCKIVWTFSCAASWSIALLPHMGFPMS